MRIKITLLIIPLWSVLFGQQHEMSRAHLNLQLGFRLHDDTYEVGKAGGERKVLASPVVGLMFQFHKIPLRIGTQVDFNVKLEVPVADSQLVNYAAGTIAETRVEYQLQAYYDFNKWTLGFGGYWKRRENFENHVDPGFFFWKYYGVQASVGIPLNWLDIEFRTKVNFQPTFAALGTSQHSILLLYNLNKTRLRQQKFKKVAVHGIVGVRFFPTKNIELLDGEDLFPIGTSILAGIELMHKKTGLSFSAERDWWLAVNGGSFRRDIKGYINTAFVSFGYHKHLKNNRFMRFKLGWAAIVDYDKGGKLRQDTPNVNKLTTYQVKGVGAAISYELFPNTDIEIRHTFPVLGDRLFNPLRTSLGLIYRYNPNN